MITKGLWRATPHHIGDGWRVHVLHTADNDMHDAICDLETWQTQAETEANARAIAAVPDLLEAARQIIWKLGHNGGLPGESITPVSISRLDITIKMLDAALAKAEGSE